MILLFLILFLLSANTSYATDPITQHGVTWTFADETNYTTGQFVNGDYWVVDPGSGVKIINISPGYTSTPRAMNGSMLNPHDVPHGYDGTREYDAAKNVGIGISAGTPLVLNGDVSLVSSISNETLAGPRNDLYINSVAVLTCLTSAPPSGSFRPGVSSTVKTLHNIASVDYSKLKSLACPVGINRPNIATYAGYLQMAFLTHGGGWFEDYMRPSASGLDNYYYPGTFAEAALLLHLDYPNSEKTTLLINFIQLGIDIYSYLESGAVGFGADGGENNGRKWPIIFAGVMLNYSPMKNIGQVSGDYLYSNGHNFYNPPTGYKRFPEDEQTFYVSQADVDITNGVTWNPDTRSAPNYPYTTAMIGMPEWGIKHAESPNQSDSSWLTKYRDIGSGAQAWAGTSLAARIMGEKSLWNHNAHFDYVDRYMAITKGINDPFGYTVPRQLAWGRPGGLIGAMWDTYRGQYNDTPRKHLRLSTGCYRRTDGSCWSW